MRRDLWVSTLVFTASLFLAVPCFSEGILVDHTSTDLAKIPDAWVDAVKSRIKVYYGHTSHGQQLVRGLEMVKTQYGRKYDVFVYENSLPNVEGALSLRNTKNTYDPKDFFATVDPVLARDPKINVVMYGWCSQPNSGKWQGMLDEYITGMNALEKRYPNVTFVYMTAHAQRKDCEGCNRHQFNEALRSYCKENGKPLFDFGDIDAWRDGSMNSYVAPRWCACAGQRIPLEHADFGGGSGKGTCGHATAESCLTKGQATWWLLARIAGWSPGR